MWRPSRIPDCHCSEKKNSLEYTPMLSEGFQNPQIGFQNPRLLFFMKKHSLEHAPMLSEGFQNPRLPFFRKKNSLEHAPMLSEGFQNPRLSCFQKKKSLSTPRFYRKISRYHFFPRSNQITVWRPSRIRDCRFSEKKNSLEHAPMLSEGFQNPGFGFQNPRLPFFRKKTQP